MNAALDRTSWLTDDLLDKKNFLSGDQWLQAFQLQQRQDFLARGLPSRKEESWKYTDIKFLEKSDFHKVTQQSMVKFDNLSAFVLQNVESIKLVFVNGEFSTALSDLTLVPNNIICCSLKTALREHSALVRTYLSQPIDNNLFPFVNLNAALLSDGLFLVVPKNEVLKVPIHLLFINTLDYAYTCPRNIIVADESSKACLLEEHYGEAAENYFTNVVTDIYTKNNAHVDYYKIQNEAVTATHIADIVVHQTQDSKVKTVSLALGSRLARENVRVYLSERSAECSINGFYCTQADGQHIDNHVQIDHIAPHGVSEMIYKGVLDKKSRAVFNGKIHVYQDAQKTQSQQANHNLLLSPNAEIDTKPEFEIYADDVKCAHADTVGQLDLESLFYLRSRGIEKAVAMKLLTRAFSDDVLKRVEQQDILQRMQTLLNQKLTYE